MPRTLFASKSTSSYVRTCTDILCWDSCTNINSACLSSGSADVAACTAQYNACYYSTSDVITLDTVAKYQNCLNAGTNVTTCNAELTNFKDACTTIQATCLVSGSADTAFCSSLSNACYYNGTQWTRESCSDAFNACTKSDSECRAELTQCKDTCTSVNNVLFILNCELFADHLNFRPRLHARPASLLMQLFASLLALPATAARTTPSLTPTFSLLLPLLPPPAL